MQDTTKPVTPENGGATITLRAVRADDPRLARAIAYTSLADDFIVDSEELFEIAAVEVAEYTRRYNEIEAQRTSITGPLNTALTNANAVFQPVLKKLDAAKKLLGLRMSEFRERERQRIARENAERERAATVERERIARQVLEAQAAGREEDAFAIRQTAALVSAPVRPTAPPKVAGVSVRTNWSAEVLDLVKLVQWVAEHPENIGYLQPNATALNATARAHRDALKIPGVRFFNRGGVAVRGSGL